MAWNTIQSRKKPAPPYIARRYLDHGGKDDIKYNSSVYSALTNQNASSPKLYYVILVCN
jgi:hypothetical protein